MLPDSDKRQTQEGIQSTTKYVKTALEALKEDFELITKTVLSQLKFSPDPGEKVITEYKVGLIDKSMEKVTLGIEESDILLALSEYLQYLRVDKMRVRLQVRRMYEENDWLNEELTNIQTRLSKLDDELSRANADKQNFQFIYNMRKYDINPVKTGEELFELVCKDETSQEEDSDVPPRLRSLNNLVVQYANQGRFEVAIPLCKQALNDMRRTHGDKHADVATMLNILALVYRDQGNYKEATCLLDEALKIREQVVGADHPSVVASLNNLAVLYGKRGRYKEAEPMARKALALRKERLGLNHPEVAKQLCNLAMLCQNLQKHDEVEELYEQALEFYKTDPIINETSIVKIKNYLATSYMKQQRFDDAEKTLKEIVDEHHEKNYGLITDLNPTYWMIAETRAKELKKVKEVVEHLINKFQRLTNPTQIVTVRNLCHLYKKRNKLEVAIVLDEWLDVSGKPPPSTTIQRRERRGETNVTMLLSVPHEEPSVSDRTDLTNTEASNTKEKKAGRLFSNLFKRGGNKK